MQDTPRPVTLKDATTMTKKPQQSSMPQSPRPCPVAVAPPERDDINAAYISYLSPSEEEATARVFAILDPVLRALLSSIERGGRRSCRSSDLADSRIRRAPEDNRDFEGKKEDGDEAVISDLRNRSEILGRLGVAISAIGGGRRGDDEHSGPRGHGLVVALSSMAEYALLPLMIILQGGAYSPRWDRSMFGG